MTKDQRYRKRLDHDGRCVVCGGERDRAAKRGSSCLVKKRQWRQRVA